MTPEQELQRAGEARVVSESPIFVEAKTFLYERMRSARRAAPLTATEMHTKLILMEQLADEFFGFFEQLAQTGKLAQDWLNLEEQRQKSWRERLLMFQRFGRNGL